MSDWDNLVSQEAKKTEDKNSDERIEKLRKTIYDDNKIKDWLFGKIEKSSSNICCALYGYDGTAKSGIAMDCRTEQEIKDGMKIVIFDLDGGCAPLKVIFHDNDPNIIIKNPLVRNEVKNVDYEATFAKLKAALDYIERNMEELKIKAIIFDGLDKFLKICEYSMREELNKDVTSGIDYRYWKNRNKKYMDILEQIKLMDLDRFFITHMKHDEDGNMIPDWQKKTPDMLYQRVRCFREIKEDKSGGRTVYLKAEIEKSKTNIALEGKIYTVAEIRHDKNGTTAKWNGLRFSKDNTIWQKEEKE